MTDQPRLLTLAEVAALLRVSEKSIRNWVRDDRFPKPLKVGVRWRFIAADIEDWMRGNTEAAS